MKISIITINYNNDTGLNRTIKSVINQTYDNIEYIIVDGGSVDDSIYFIESYKDRIAYWISEPDKGIYDAMNKGINVSTGAYLLFLNSGDVLFNSDIISLVINKIEKNPTDIIYGNLISVDSKGKEQFITYPNKLSFNYFLYKSLPHPATLISRSLFNKYGLFDASLKICSDWKFFLIMICKHNRSYKHLDISISKFDMGGISSNVGMVRIEQAIVFKQEFPNFIDDYIQFEQLHSFKREVESLKVIRLLIKMGLIKVNEVNENHPFKITE